MLRHFDWNNFQSPGQPFPCVDKADREYIMGYFRIIAGVFPLVSRHLNGVIFLSGYMNIEYCAVVRGVCRSPDLLGGLLLLQCLSTGCKIVPEVVTGSFFPTWTSPSRHVHRAPKTFPQSPTRTETAKPHPKKCSYDTTEIRNS